MHDPSIYKREYEICAEQIRDFELQRQYAGRQKELVESYDRRIAQALQRQNVAQMKWIEALMQK